MPFGPAPSCVLGMILAWYFFPLSLMWCSVSVRAKEMVILGTQYAGEMKKGIFTVMHYLMPKRGILSLHSGCNVGKNDDVTLFFGLSGIPSS